MLKEKIDIDEKPRKKRRTGDEIWDDLLKTPESDILLKLLADQAIREDELGLTEIGGFDDSIEEK